MNKNYSNPFEQLLDKDAPTKDFFADSILPNSKDGSLYLFYEAETLDDNLIDSNLSDVDIPHDEILERKNKEILETWLKNYVPEKLEQLKETLLSIEADDLESDSYISNVERQYLQLAIEDANEVIDAIHEDKIFLAIIRVLNTLSKEIAKDRLFKEAGRKNFKGGKKTIENHLRERKIWNSALKHTKQGIQDTELYNLVATELEIPPARGKDRYKVIKAVLTDLENKLPFPDKPIPE